MKTKLPPGPIRPSGNYYLLNCVPFKKKNHIEDLFNKHLSGKHDLGDSHEAKRFYTGGYHLYLFTAPRLP